jgi:hypothetical protein
MSQEDNHKALTAFTAICNMGVVYIFFSLIDLIVRLVVDLSKGAS